MAMTLKAGVPLNYFHINGRKKQCGGYSYCIENAGSPAVLTLIIWPKEKNKQSPEASAPITEVLNGDSAEAPFANEAAIETWLGANFFF